MNTRPVALLGATVHLQILFVGAFLSSFQSLSSPSSSSFLSSSSSSSSLSSHEEEQKKIGKEMERELGQGFNFFPNPFLSFFTIHVKPNPCQTDSGLSGICHSGPDCLAKGGKSSGSCASGLGVCCVLEHRCGAIVKGNNSVLVNDDYPLESSGPSNCQYIIKKMSPKICQLRLDFDTLQLQGPDEGSSLCEEDSLSVVGTDGANPGAICGTNSGQHIYVDLASGSSTLRINIATTTAGTLRSWKIRVAQIHCDSLYKAPTDCLQYFTENSGLIRSFNYQLTDGVHHLGGLSYAVCVKRGEGYCGITYQSDSFSVSGNSTDEDEALSGDEDCKGDFVSTFVQDKTGQVSPDRFCGTGLNDTTTFAPPFHLRVVTDASEPADDVDNYGFLIKYIQIPC